MRTVNNYDFSRSYIFSSELTLYLILLIVIATQQVMYSLKFNGSNLNLNSYAFTHLSIK